MSEVIEVPVETEFNIIKFNLSMFNGTENYHQYLNVHLTDGVKYLAEACEAYWLLDVICSYQPNLKDAGFQVWILKLDEGEDSALVTCEDGNGHALVQQFIEFTDFPLPSVKVYLIDGIILLPSEY